ncbi:MAG: TIGR02281 family clan AA aspartic protease [Mariprofundaceae bacterium]
MGAALLFMGQSALAGIYTWTDKSGRLHYSDKPVAGSEARQSGAFSSIGNPNYNLSALKMQVPFRQVNGAMLVQGSVNGIAMPFVVDTGASFVVIPPAIAARAGINTAGAQQVKLQTANGTVMAPMVLLDDVKVSQLSRQGINAVVQKISGDGRTGLLGMSFLSAYKVTVDHDRSMLLLEPR